MYIRKVKKRNGVSPTDYEYLQLVENIRTDKGPRQRLVLTLGKLDLPESQWSSLSKRIEDILTGQESFHAVDGKVDSEAKKFARHIFEKRALEQSEGTKRQVEAIDTESFETTDSRSLGAEYLCHSLWNEFRLSEFFLSHKVPATVLPVLEAEVLGRLIEPSSELHTQYWAEETSAVYELTGAPLRHALSSYYRATDRIFKLKDELEAHLVKRENDLFDLDSRFLFLDLTNTYFEGQCRGNKKAQYGHSKEKRYDCRLVTLGLIVDEQGFAKGSNLFGGNQAEAPTLPEMIQVLEKRTGKLGVSRTVVMDAGLASKENLEWLTEHGYHYLVVNRGQAPFPLDQESMTVIREDASKGICIEVKRFEKEGECFVLCRSSQKQKKEEGMRTRVETIFLERLESMQAGLRKPHGRKVWKTLLERVGRLKEKYPTIARLYDVKVMSEDTPNEDLSKKTATDLTWSRKELPYRDRLAEEGTYILRTDRLDLSEKEIWDTYIMLGQIEHAFLNMKSHLGLRPNFHQKERRTDAHMFISVLAYHLLHAIEHRLRRQGDHRSWATIRTVLSTHQRLTLSYQAETAKNIFSGRTIRMSTKPEAAHQDIYTKLGLSGKPLPRLVLEAEQALEGKRSDE